MKNCVREKQRKCLPCVWRGRGIFLDAFVFYTGNIFYLSHSPLSLSLSLFLFLFLQATVSHARKWNRLKCEPALLAWSSWGGVGGIKKWGGRKEGLLGWGGGWLRLRVFKNQGLYIFNVSREIANGTLCFLIVKPSIRGRYTQTVAETDSAFLFLLSNRLAFPGPIVAAPGDLPPADDYRPFTWKFE